MDCNCGVYVSYDKDDIVKDCKYCRKTDKKGFGDRESAEKLLKALE